ncbi:MAG: SulP family inorganic anion transporter [Anaerolineae bacterium]|nr:SulP family inorganic anion transporter [Anaerolineae bacterium]
MNLPAINKDDVVAGLTGAIAGTPQAMGFALIAGVNPIYGLYTAVVSTIVGTILGNSTFMTIGPTNALSLVVFSAIGHLTGDIQLAHMVVLTLLVGIFYLLFGVLRLGFFIRFVSNAVMTGFVTGAGLLIIFGQIRHLNGYSPYGDSVVSRVGDWMLNFHQSQIETIFVSIMTLILILLIKRTHFKNYAVLVSFALVTLMITAIGWHDVPLVRDISYIPQGLPNLLMPDFTLMAELAPTALAIAILGAVQSAAITNSVKEVPDKRVNVNRDFIGMGFANLAGGFFQSMPACGSLSRTAINMDAGAKSRASNIFAGIFVAIFLLLFGSWIELVPLPSLSIQLILAAISLISIREIVFIWRVHFSARVAMVATFFSALFLPLEYSIYIGVGISLLLYLANSANAISAVRLVPLEDGRYQSHPMPTSLPDNEITLFSIHGNLYFAAVSTLGNILPDPAHAQGAIVILRLRENTVLASTGIHFLEDYDKALKANGGRLILVGLSPTTRQNVLNSSMRQFEEQDLYLATDVIFEATTQAYADAKRASASM